jgi:hypothetical protein
MAGAIPHPSEEEHIQVKEEKKLTPEEEKKREAEKLLQQRFKTFDLYSKEINSLMELWDRSQGAIFRQPSPSEKSEHDDHLNKKNLKAYQKSINQLVNFLFPKDGEDVSILNNKLYITYYDTKNNKQIVVSKYKNNQHLINCILRSSHIPYIIDGNSRYNERYIDGITPYIFKETSGIRGDAPYKNNSNWARDFAPENLFIKLLTFSKCSRSMVVKNENNIHYRLIVGVSDANEFFTTGKSDMCSYTSKWNIFDIIQLRARESIVLLIFSIIEWLILFKGLLPTYIKSSLLYNGLTNSFSGLINDIIRRTII